MFNFKRFLLTGLLALAITMALNTRTYAGWDFTFTFDPGAFAMNEGKTVLVHLTDDDGNVINPGAHYDIFFFTSGLGATLKKLPIATEGNALHAFQVTCFNSSGKRSVSSDQDKFFPQGFLGDFNATEIANRNGRFVVEGEVDPADLIAFQDPNTICDFAPGKGNKFTPSPEDSPITKSVSEWETGDCLVDPNDSTQPFDPDPCFDNGVFEGTENATGEPDGGNRECTFGEGGPVVDCDEEGAVLQLTLLNQAYVFVTILATRPVDDSSCDEVGCEYVIQECGVETNDPFCACLQPGAQGSPGGLEVCGGTP